MIPHRWHRTDDMPYSSITPLLERSVRHSQRMSKDQSSTIIGTTLGLSIVLPIIIVLTRNSTSRVGVLIPLFIAWIITLTTIIATAVLGAISTFAQRNSSDYHLIWLTPLSDQALGNGLLFATLYRMRFSLLVTLAMAPTLILGMIYGDGWAVKDCVWVPWNGRCHPVYGETVNLYGSMVYGILMWLTCMSVIASATMAAIGLTLRWHNSTMATAATLIMTMFGLGLILLLSIFVITPPLNKIDGWGAPVTVVMLLVLCSYAWMALRHEPITESSLKLIVVTMWALFASIAGFSFVFWSSDIQANLLFLEVTALLPLVAFYVAANQFWRGTRSDFE